MKVLKYGNADFKNKGENNGMTVRIFCGDSVVELERKINGFINVKSNIVDIKFSATNSYGHPIYTAMVIMEEI